MASISTGTSSRITNFGFVHDRAIRALIAAALLHLEAKTAESIGAEEPGELEGLPRESVQKCGRLISMVKHSTPWTHRRYGGWHESRVPVLDAFANFASRPGDSSPLSAATRTCARQWAPSSVHRICCFFAMRWLTTRFTADSAMLLLMGKPLL